ncbi:MAG: glycosyltransferase family 4 protein [Mucilaginibacter polytrichastri]|nr:glycosyltransferase family 4 protein [Mucilaginibacter polytrichastri]
MRIAVLSPVAWRTPPRHYGPWEQVALNITEGLVNLGHEVTLFATGDSQTSARLEAICDTGYEEDRSQDAKVLECLHIAHLMEQSSRFDIIHNNFDFLPLTYSRFIATPMVTTIHGFSSPRIIPVYKKYNAGSHYVSISNSDRSDELIYAATVYNGLKTEEFIFNDKPQDYLLFFGRIHPHKGTADAISIAKKSGRKLIIAGIIQDEHYFNTEVKPYLDDEQIRYIGHAGPEKRRELLANAYALLHPIFFDEPFGMSVAEAMLCGTPVIAYNRGSMPELIDNGRTGFLVHNKHEAVDALNELSTLNRSDCHAWANAHFTQEKMVADYVKVYEKVLSR